MQNIEGFFFDGKISHRKEARLSIQGDIVRIDSGVETVLNFKKEDVLSCPRPGSKVLAFEFADGSIFESYDFNFETDFSRFDYSLHTRLEKHWRKCTLGFFVLIFSFLFFYWQLLPNFARQMATQVPKSIEIQIGKQIEQWLIREKAGNPEPRWVNKLSYALEPIKSLYPELELSFDVCCTKVLMLNAFTLPGGKIFATQALISELSTDELTAVLLHEVGHVYYHHPMQMLIEKKFVSALFMFIAGYGNSYDWGREFISLSHSRDLEKEADLFAADALKKIGLSPQVLADVLDYMTQLSKSDKNRFEWLSNHPLTEDRKKYLEAL